MQVDLSRAVGRLIWPGTPRRALARYAVALILPVIAIIVSISFFTLSRAPFFVLFTVSVMFAAMYGGWKPGIVCTLFSALLNVLALPPSFTFRVNDPENMARVLVFSFAGFGISAFVAVIAELQEKLDAQRERYRVTLASIGDAVIATDRSGRITFLNAVAEETTGWNAEQAHGRPLADVFRIVNASTRAEVPNPIQKVFESGRVVGLANHTILIRRDGSEIPIDDSAAPIRDVRGRIIGAVLVFRDISQQKEVDAALLRSEKLASVGRLAATIAHEINNPLEAISNLLFLLRRSEDQDEIERYLSAAEHELSRVSEVTKQTLSFAKRENRHELVQVADLLDGVLVLYSNKIHSKNISLHKEFDLPVTVFGTRSEVRQVLGNLIGNGLDALSPNGTLFIRLHAAKLNGRPAARILVADTGHGIPAEDMPKLFEAFFTTKKDVGTGLGLWLTKQIVDSHGGTIRVRSVVGKGTAVSVCWPAVEETFSADEKRSEAATQ